jgi:hypothetical protein
MSKPMTIGDPMSCGARLKDASDCLQSLACRLPRGRRASRQARRAWRAIDDLRCTLDAIICADVPRERDPRNIAVKIDYGRTRFEAVLTDDASLARDAFVGFKIERL